MIRLPPRSTPPVTLTPDTTLVRSVEIGSYAIAAGHLGPSWGNMLAAQMSYKFVVATALERRSVDLAHFAPDALTDPAVVRHGAKVTVDRKSTRLNYSH